MADNDVVAGDGKGSEKIKQLFGPKMCGEAVVDFRGVPPGFAAYDLGGLDGSGVRAGDYADVLGCEGLDCRRRFDEAFLPDFGEGALAVVGPASVVGIEGFTVSEN